MMSPDFKPEGRPIKLRGKKAKESVSRRIGGVSPGVKNFAFIGLAILIFSIFYKNHFNINNVVSEVKYFFTRIAKGKFIAWESDKKKDDDKIEWINVRSFGKDWE